MAKKRLVIYYSLEGSTRLLAGIIAKALSADLLECKPLKDISPKNFMKYVWGGRQVILKKEPELEPLGKNPDGYGSIIIGTPVWAFNYAPPIRSFLSQHKLKNKKIALFCCHEGNKGKTLDNLRESLKENAIISSIDFLNVKKNSEENILKAKKWAAKIKGLL